MMMAVRRCTTQPGIGKCCQAASQGLINKPMIVTTTNGRERCAICTITQSQSKDPRKRGRNIFQFRFLKNGTCGIGPSGCAYLGGNQGQQNILPPPAGF